MRFPLSYFAYAVCYESNCTNKEGDGDPHDDPRCTRPLRLTTFSFLMVAGIIDIQAIGAIHLSLIPILIAIVIVAIGTIVLRREIIRRSVLTFVRHFI